MTSRARKILLAAALLCSIAGAFAYWRHYHPLEGTPYRYEVRENSTLWRLKWSNAVPVAQTALHPIEPASPTCSAWTAVVPSAADEKPGVVLFKADGTPTAFLPCAHSETVNAASASPLGRVIALVRDRRGEIEFFALPECVSLGTIHAFGPVLWDAPTSGTAFDRSGKKIGFTMAPEK